MKYELDLQDQRLLGREEGREETIKRNIESLMETLNFTFDKAAKAPKLTTDEYNHYKNSYLVSK